MTTQNLPLTPKQDRILARWERRPWRWFCSDARFRALEDRFERDNQRRYYEVLNRVTTYDGPDYRLRVEGQKTRFRATRLQYLYAENQPGVERSIGVPELAAVPALAA